MFRLLNLFTGAEKINDYFAGAAMINFLRTIAANAREDIGDEDAYYRLNQLADEICFERLYGPECPL